MYSLPSGSHTLYSEVSPQLTGAHHSARRGLAALTWHPSRTRIRLEAGGSYSGRVSTQAILTHEYGKSELGISEALAFCAIDDRCKSRIKGKAPPRPGAFRDRTTHLCAPYSCSRRITSADEMCTGLLPLPAFAALETPVPLDVRSYAAAGAMMMVVSEACAGCAGYVAWWSWLR